MKLRLSAEGTEVSISDSTPFNFQAPPWPYCDPLTVLQ